MLGPGFSGYVSLAQLHSTQAVTHNPQEVMQFLEANKVFKGPDDPARTYVVGPDGRLTIIGQKIYQYYKDRPKEVRQELAPTFETFRGLGPYTEKQDQAARQAIENFVQQYGSVVRSDPESAWSLGSLLQTVMTNVATVKGDGRAIVQVETPRGVDFVDGQGIVQRVNKNGVQVFNREILALQRRMNDPKNRPAYAPLVPQTGRYNYEMLEYTAVRLEEQVEKLERQAHLDRLVRMAELLGRQYKADQLVKDTPRPGVKGPKELEMERLEPMRAFFGLIRGADRTAGALADRHLTERRAHLAEARSAIAFFRGQMKDLKYLQVVNDGHVKAMDANEKLVVKWLSLAHVETQKFALTNQLERLGYEARMMNGRLSLVPIPGGTPDTTALEHAVQETNQSDAQRAAYLAQRRPMALDGKHNFEQLLALERQLKSRDYATGLGATQTALSNNEKSLQQYTLDSSLYTAIPALSRVASDESSGLRIKMTPHKRAQGEFFEIRGDIPIVAHWGTDKIHRVASAVGLDWGRQYLDNRATMERHAYAWHFESLFSTVAGSNRRMDATFRDVRQGILAMDPDASRSHGARGHQATTEEPSDSQRVQAAIAKAEKVLDHVSKTHEKWSAFVNILEMAAGAAVFAPAMSLALTGPGRLLIRGGELLVNAPQKWTHGVGYLARGAGHVFENAGMRIRALGAPPGTLKSGSALLRVAENAMVRAANTTGRLGAFALMSGGISSGFLVGQKYIDGDHSPIGSYWEAAQLGFWGGFKWAAESWHGLLIVGGLPSSVYDGTRAAGVAEAVATRGALGLASTGATSGFARLGMTRTAAFLDKISLANLSNVRGLKTISQILGTLDNVAKFMLPSFAFKEAARQWTFRTSDIDERTIERRIKQAEAAGMTAMQAPIWLLIPVHPAAAEAAASEVLAARQGYQEAIAAHMRGDRAKLDLILTRGPDARLTLDNPPKVPILQRLFNLQVYSEKAEVDGRVIDAAGTFKVSKEMYRQAVRFELPYAAAGKKAGQTIDPLAVEPYKYYAISQKEHGKVGRLWLTRVINDEAYNLFALAIEKNLPLAEKVMSAKNLGETLPEFGGLVRGRHQEDVALVLDLAAREGRVKLSKSQRAMVDTLLEPFAVSERPVMSQAVARREALLALERTPELSRYVETMIERVTEWKKKIDETGGKHPESYMDVVRELRNQAKASGLSKSQQRAVEETWVLLDKVEARFNYFNRLDRAAARLERDWTVRRKENAGDPVLKAALELMTIRARERVDALGKTEAKGKEAPAARHFRELRDELEGTVRAQKKDGFSADDLALLSSHGWSAADLAALKASKGLTKAQASVLEAAVREVEMAPWLLRDTKGTALKGWKPEQFEAAVYFFAAELDPAYVQEATRVFLMLKTSGGKTLLSIELLSPIMEANGLDTFFLTPQTNLESQARMEFRSLRKVLSRLQFDTWEGHKNRVAQGKLKGKPGDGVNILGDEADAAGTQPILTIGERTASIARQHGAYRRLVSIGDRITEHLAKRAASGAEDIVFLVERQLAVIEDMPQSSALSKTMRRSASELLAAAKDLGAARTQAKFDEAAARVKDILRTQEELLQATGGESPASRVALESLAQLDALTARLEAARDSGEIRAAAREIDALLLGAERDAAKTAGKGAGRGRSDAERRATPPPSAETRALTAMFQSARTKVSNMLSAKALQGRETEVAAAKHDLIESARRLAAAPGAEAQFGQRGAAELRLIRRLARGLETASSPAEVRAAAAKLAERLEAPAAAASARAKSGGFKALERGRSPGETEVLDARERAAKLLKAADASMWTGEASRILRGLSTEARKTAESSAAPDAEAVAALRETREELAKALETAVLAREALNDLKLTHRRASFRERFDAWAEQRGVWWSFPVPVKPVLRLLPTIGDILLPRASQESALRRALARAEKRADAAEIARARARLEAVRSYVALTEQVHYLMRMQRSALRNARWLKGGEANRGEILDLGRQIEALARDVPPGWEAQMKALLARRAGLIERSIDSRSRIYETFRKMREDAYSHFASAFRVRNDSIAVADAPGELRKALQDNASTLVRELDAARRILDKAAGPAPEAPIVPGDGLASFVNESKAAAAAAKDPARALLREAERLVERAHAAAAEWDARAVKVADAANEPAPGGGPSPVHQSEQAFRASAERMRSIYDFIHEAQARVTAVEARLETVSKETTGKLSASDAAEIEAAVDALYGSIAEPGARQALDAARAKAKAGEAVETVAQLEAAARILKAAAPANEPALVPGDGLASFVNESKAAGNAARDPALRKAAEAQSLANLAKSKAADVDALAGRKGAAEAELKTAREQLQQAREEFEREGERAKLSRERMDQDVEFKRLLLSEAMSEARAKEEAGAGGARDELADAIEALKAKTADADILKALDSALGAIKLRDSIWGSHIDRLEMASERAVSILERRIDGDAWLPHKDAGGWKMGALLKTNPFELLAWVVAGRAPSKPGALGMTRLYARRLLQSLWDEPYMHPTQRWKLFWTILPSMLHPRGLTGEGSSWVRTELINLARGYGEDPNTIRMDHANDTANAVHIGQWFESMDTPYRRWAEIKFNTDLTLPYEHKTQATMKDILENPKVNMVAFSGTASPRYRGILSKNRFDIRGVGSVGAETKLELYGTVGEKYQTVRQAVMEAAKEDGTLVVTMVPGTRELKVVEAFSSRVLKADEVGKVFSDAEFLRNNRGEARVLEQMNLKGLDVGKIDQLITDIRVAGRGMDMNFKGGRGDPTNPFAGYKKIVMLILDPQAISPEMQVQGQGRIDWGRVNAGTIREFRLLMDIPTAQKDPLFADLIESNPLFYLLRRDAAVQRLAAEKGLATPDWAAIHEYIVSLEKSGEKPGLTRQYREELDRFVRIKQDQIGEDQLRSSGMLSGSARPNRMMRGLEAPKH
ncbi:MAG: hypothetical protein HY059_09965 [Proteobacteria bacterium]|nr:hypothetical protein [Pseudomonadota bacterium]